MHINTNGQCLTVTLKYNADAVAAIKAINGRKFNAKLKRWEIPLDNAVEALDVLEPLGFIAHIDVKRLVDSLRKDIETAEKFRSDPDAYTGKLPLYDFQKIGTSFLKHMPGALLADVPGLGKTIQTIAALEGSKRVLILCPASLKYSWKDEIEKWSENKLSTLESPRVIDGNAATRANQWMITTKWTIANYELLLRDWDYMPHVWDAVVCDEATRISNPTAKTTKIVKQLNAKKRIALSGTPVSNSPEDLWSIIDWVRPGYLGTFWQFQEKYCVKEPAFHRIVGYKNLDDLAGRVARFMLRRTKEEVLKDFPPKTIEHVAFNLSPAEQQLYTGVRLQLMEEMGKLKVDAHTLALMPVKMLRLKQVTDHPTLITKSEKEKSTKLECLKDLLKPIAASGEKAIIFTQFAEMAKILELELKEYGPTMIFGEKNAVERAQACQDFMGSPDRKVMIMTEAGAYGLNLQAASYVIHYDAPWSIAKLMQREDRAHRIGQTKPVTVYCLVARKTIDEYVMKVLHRKQRTSVNLLGDADRLEAMGLTEEDIHSILRLT